MRRSGLRWLVVVLAVAALMVACGCSDKAPATAGSNSPGAAPSNSSGEDDTNEGMAEYQRDGVVFSATLKEDAWAEAKPGEEITVTGLEDITNNGTQPADLKLKVRYREADGKVPVYFMAVSDSGNYLGAPPNQRGMLALPVPSTGLKLETLLLPGHTINNEHLPAGIKAESWERKLSADVKGNPRAVLQGGGMSLVPSECDAHWWPFSQKAGCFVRVPEDAKNGEVYSIQVAVESAAGWQYQFPFVTKIYVKR